LGETKSQVAKRYTENRKAYELYMQGLYYFYNKRVNENLEKAVECYHEAIRKDSDYALAYAQLAETYLSIGGWGYLPPREIFPKAIEAANKALKIDNGLAEARSAVAYKNYGNYLHLALLWKFIAKAMYDKALEKCQKSNDQLGIGIVYAKIGKKTEAQKISRDLIIHAEHNSELTHSIAQLFFALEENDQAFHWLEKAYEYRHSQMIGLKISPAFNSVRDDPRFKDMLRRVGLEK